MDRQTDSQADWLIYWLTDTQTKRQTDELTKRKTERQTVGKSGRPRTRDQDGERVSHNSTSSDFFSLKITSFTSFYPADAQTNADLQESGFKCGRRKAKERETSDAKAKWKRARAKNVRSVASFPEMVNCWEWHHVELEWTDKKRGRGRELGGKRCRIFYLLWQ